KEEPELFESVFYRRDLSALKSKALHYLPPAELAKLEEQLAAAAALLPQQSQAADPTAQLATLNDRLAHLGIASADQRQTIEAQYSRAAGWILAELSAAMPNAIGAVVPASVDFGSPPGPSFEALSQLDPHYLTVDGGKLGFVLTRLLPSPGESAAGSQAIGR